MGVIMEQKQWVRITAVFFAWMAVLTVFSRAAASAAKAKVTVTKASSQTITHEFQVDGTVEAEEHSLQYVPAGLMVKSVKASPGQHVGPGDVLFTVDTQKLEEKIGELEAGIAEEKHKSDVLLARAEKSYRNVEENAKEEKALAYRVYAKAAEDYQEYINTHTPMEHTELLETATPEDAAPDGSSLYQESAAMELKNAMDAAQSAYEMAAREQDKLTEAAADSFQQAKEDAGPTQEAKELEELLEELKPYLKDKGQYLAKTSGVVGKVFVEPGTETSAGVAVLIADSSAGVRLTAPFPEEYREEITASSKVTLTGENADGDEESYVCTDVAVAKNNAAGLGTKDSYILTVNIPGDLYPVGSSVSVTVANESEEYATCIPLRCLRQNGNNQYFIYLAEEQDTVLGKELAAKEMPVTVLDKNGKYAAIEENIFPEQQVVESANKDIADGSRIKIAE